MVYDKNKNIKIIKRILYALIKLSEEEIDRNSTTITNNIFVKSCHIFNYKRLGQRDN